MDNKSLALKLMAHIKVNVAETTEFESNVEHDVTREVVQQKVKTKWTSYIWDTLDKSPQERKFLFKLDADLLTFASLGMKIFQDCVNRGHN